MQHQREEEGEGFVGAAAQLTDEERYRDCERFTLACPRCRADNVYDNVFDGAVSPGALTHTRAGTHTVRLMCTH